MSDNIITITDFMDPNLDVYARLTENQLLNRANPKEGMFIAESPKVIERQEALSKDVRIYLYILRHLICSQS